MEAECKVCGTTVWLDVIRAHAEGAACLEVLSKMCSTCGSTKWGVTLDFGLDIGG